ncbi:ARM repeat-containing protein [Amylocystis lapponica]|nr:ARM repeat-containing protein [Amylocystis lapponica]
MASVQDVLSALAIFSRAPDKASLDHANVWLQDFQHSRDAWATCNVLLLSPEAPVPAKLFAAQTFRTKVTYDLHEMNESDVFQLRDTLVTALETYHAGPRTIMVQLCLAISGLALQLSAWEDPVQNMIDSFGRNPATVPALLQFLTILPEELNSTKRVSLLSMYMQATGVTPAVQGQIFRCLSSWLAAGEVTASSLAQTPLLPYAFNALESDELFDAAVAVVCDLIHETQEIEDNMQVIEVVVPRIISLKPKLTELKDDPEKIRGFARIFTEAGETYRSLLLHHPETFFPIVDAIGVCSAYSDLDIVPITFHFWMRLAQSIGKRSSVSPPFIDAYKALIGELPVFRHVMGDTLKDCCYVLGADTCLLSTYDLITTALKRGPSAISWQEIEAPLFAMRSMGAEVDPTDDKAVPKIMDLIPSLPLHPRVRYAALLIISRYTEWINRHPDYIPYQLQYISAGFEDSDTEVNAAAGQALKFLCQDCRRHLVDFLPQLHTFLATMGSKLGQDEKIQVYEAIAYVISAMPMEQAAQSLRTFSLEILAHVHMIATRPTQATKEELYAVGCKFDVVFTEIRADKMRLTTGGLENLEVMLGVIDTFGDELPAACQNSSQEAWLFFEPFIAKYGSEYSICERTTRVLRFGLTFFGTTVKPILPSILKQMSAAFEVTGFSSYLWIVGKIVGRFGNEEDPTLRTAYKDVFERSSQKMVLLLQEKAPGEIPDVMEDYLQMLLQMIEYAPDIFFPSFAFPIAFRAAMAALTVVHSDIIFAALDLIRNILTHDSLAPPSSVPPPPKFPIYAAAIRPVVEKEGVELTGYLLAGLSTPIVVTIFRVVASLWQVQLLSWLPTVLQQLPTTSVPDQTKTQFLADMNSALQSKEYDKVKYAIIALHRASRKARERRRAGPLDA